MKIKPITDIKFGAVVLLPLLGYLAIRADKLSFTYDECWTYLGYTESLWYTISNHHPAANNHILHSLMMMMSKGLFGSSEFALRLPTVLSFVPFFCFSFLLLRKLIPNQHRIAIVILCCQPYLLDYFVAARGYGLALAMLMGAVYFMIQFAEEGTRKSLILSLFFAFLSAYSNFTFLLSTAIIFGLNWMLNVQKHFLTGQLPFIGMIGLMLLLFGIPIWKLRSAEEFYYGGQKGFFQDTLMSLGHSLGYHEVGATPLAIGLLLLIAGAGYLVWFYRSNWRSAPFIIPTLLLGLCAEINIQHFVMGTPYLIDRTAIILVPFFILVGLQLLQRIQPKSIRNASIGGALLAVLINLSMAFNLTHFVDFKEYADVGTAMKKLNSANDGTASYRIGKSTYLNAPINYYRERYEMVYVQHSGLEYCEPSPFYLLFEKDLDCLTDRDVELLEYYPNSKLYLYQSK